MVYKDIKELEKNLEERLKNAKDQTEADSIGMLILLSNIKNNLKYPK